MKMKIVKWILFQKEIIDQVETTIILKRDIYLEVKARIKILKKVKKIV